jgi:ribosomal protein S18 acetylase RimI-like enzyme
MGVDRPEQGQGAGHRLVETFIGESAGGCDRLRVGTQLANIPSIRLYEKCGFRLAASEYVLHAHVREGRVLG